MLIGYAAVAMAEGRVLHLADVERAAQAHQPQLLAARTSTLAAESRVDQAGAALLPQVNATAQYQRKTGNIAANPGTYSPTKSSTSLAPTYDAYNIGVTASQLLYDFGQTRDRIAVAQAGRDVLRSGEKAAELQVVAGVRRAFFVAQAQKAVLAVARENLANQQRHQTQIQGFVKVGTRPDIDLVQAKTNVANAEVGVITAQNNYDGARAQLNQAAGLVGNTDFDVGDEQLPAVAGEEQPLAPLMDKAVVQRPEMEVLSQQKRQQDLQLQLVHHNLWPTIAATAGATEVGITIGGMVPNWNLGAVVTWPIFQGGINKAQVREAQANLQNIAAQESVQVLQIQTDIEQARLAVGAQKATISAAEVADLNAKELLRMAEARYNAGVSSMLELNDTQLAATSAAVQLVTARFNLSMARAQLLAALGLP